MAQRRNGRAGGKLTRDELIAEAKLETEAIQRLMVWLRLGYSLVAIGFILGLWGSQAGMTPAMIGGAACVLVGGVPAIVLKIGTENGKRNVRALLEAAGVDLDASGAGADGEVGAGADGGVADGGAVSGERPSDEGAPDRGPDAKA